MLSPEAVLSTMPQMLDHISRRRNVRASSGEDGIVAWLQRDFNGHEQLFACDARSFQHSATPQECLLTQLEGGVALMELVPDVEDCCENDALRGRCAVVSAVDGGDALYVLHVPSGSSSRNMLPPGHRVRAIVSSPTRPEHLLLIMRSAIAPSHCDDVYRLDLATGQLSLDTRNPGFVVQWLADLSTLSVRACVCAHSPQTPDVSALYVKARGRGGGAWVHVCELPLGGHIAGFADAGDSLVVMNRTAASNATFTAEKHLLPPLLSAAGQRQRVVLCSDATGKALALQDTVLFETSAADTRSWQCSDASALPGHIHALALSRHAALDLDVSCPCPDLQSLLVVAADACNGSASHRTMILQPDGRVVPLWAHSAPLPPIDCTSSSLAIHRGPPLHVTALLPPAASAVAPPAPPPAVLCSFNFALSNAQQRLFFHVLCHALADDGYTVIEMDSSHWNAHSASQLLVHAAQWAAVNRLCASDRVALMEFGSAFADDPALSQLFVCAVSIRRPVGESTASSGSSSLLVPLASPTDAPSSDAVQRVLQLLHRYARA